MVKIKRKLLSLSELNNKSLEFSRFLHILKKVDTCCLFHSLSIGKLFVDQSTFLDIKKAIENRQVASLTLDKTFEPVLKFMYEHYMIVEKGDDDIAFDLAKRTIYEDWGIRLLYLIVSDNCNLGCKYCFIEKNFSDSISKTNMSPEVGTTAVEYFSEVLDNTAKSIQMIFYGGEPLVNFEVIKVITQKVNQLREAGKIPSQVSLNLLTNATLVTEEIAQFLHKNNILVGVSIDGPRELHDQMRVYPDGSGSFDDVWRGITILKKYYGKNLGFSVVPGPHNIERLPEVIEWLITQVGAEKIGISLPTHPFFFDPERVALQIFNSYLILRKYNLGEDRIVRILRPLVDEKIYAADCGAIGGQIIAAPDGKVGVCHG